MAEFTPTEEQEIVVASNAPRLKVKAFAGATKTTTCDLYARARPGKNIMYLAFNKSTATEAQARFPRNVKCTTTHALAFGRTGRMYQHKLGSPRANSIAQHMNIQFVQAGKALEVINNYLTSADEKISMKHVPEDTKEMNAGRLIDISNRIWTQMQDSQNSAVAMPHDGYLKLFQLSKPKVTQTDIIILDEAQDTNPVTLDIVLSQSCGIVAVGDSHQSIYQFRNAVDALGKFNADEELRLTQSFRFGKGVAELASTLLRVWKEENTPIIGKGKYDTIFHVDMNAPHAKLARTNGGIFEAAVEVYRQGLPYGFLGGVEGYRMDGIMNAYLLYANRQYDIKDKYIRDFGEFQALREYAESMEDYELKHLIKCVDNYGHEIPALIDGIKANAIPQLTGQEIVFSTAHKSKGAEFDSVLLLDDYPDLAVKENDKGIKEYPSEEDINITYVAMTRAKRCLQVNSSVEMWLRDIGRLDLIGGHGVPVNNPPRSAPEVKSKVNAKQVIPYSAYMNQLKRTWMNRVDFNTLPVAHIFPALESQGVPDHLIRAFCAKEYGLLSADDVLKCLWILSIPVEN